MKGRLIHAAPEWRNHSNGNPNNKNGRNYQQPSTTEELTVPIPITRNIETHTSTKSTKRNGTDIPTSQAYRLFLFLLACCQNALMGGLVYGWPALSNMLTEPPNPKGGCGLRLAQTTVLFTLASITGMISTLVLGYLLDIRGPRFCSLCSHISILCGCIGFSRSSHMMGYGVSMCCIGFGGPGIGVSIVHLANLFPRNQFTALSLLNGSISISMSVFALFGFLWETYDWIAYRHLFEHFGGLVALSMMATLYIWPDYSFKSAAIARHAKPTVEDDYIEATTAHQRWMTEQPLDSFLRQNQPGLERHNSFLVSKKAMESGLTDQISLKDAPFWRQFCSGYYIRGNAFFLVICFWANFYVASITMELADANVFAVSEQNQLMRVFGCVMGCGVVASFVIGVMMDHFGVEVASIWTIGLAMAHQLIGIFAVQRSWMLIGFVIYVFYRQFLFPVGIAMITARLGFKYFGLLNGIGFLLSGLAQGLMVPVVKLVQGRCHEYGSVDIELMQDSCNHGNWDRLHVVELLSFMLLFLVPIYDYRDKLAERKQLRQLAKRRSSWRVLYGGNYDSTASMSPLLERSAGSTTSYGSNSPKMNRVAAIEERRDNVLLEENGGALEF